MIPVHWTVEAHDWHHRFGPEEVVARVLHALEPGAIVVLHDGGRGGPTAAAALPDLLQLLGERGYRAVPVGELTGLQTGGFRDLALRLWRAEVRLFDRLVEMDYLTEHAQGVFRISLSRYAGPPLDLPDGTRFLPGTPAAEIHLHSPRLQAAAGDNPRAALRLLRHSMRDVARAAQEHPKYRDLPLFFGVSLRPELYQALGARVTEFPARRPFLARYLRFLRLLHGSRPSRRRLEPKLVWLDRKTLIARYGADPPTRRSSGEETPPRPRPAEASPGTQTPH
jgi:SAM-dependent methyltransferase